MRVLVVADDASTARLARACRFEGLEVAVGPSPATCDAETVTAALEAEAADALLVHGVSLERRLELARATEAMPTTWIGASASCLEALAAPSALSALAARAGVEVAGAPPTDARRIEVVVACGGHAPDVVLGDVDRSARRRDDWIVEESPAPSLDARVRATLHSAALAVASGVGAMGVASIAFHVDAAGVVALVAVDPDALAGHPALESAIGIDLVRARLRMRGSASTDAEPRDERHAIAMRIHAEDADRGFLPSPGAIERLQAPGGPGVRWDAAAAQGDAVTVGATGLATITAVGGDRDEALALVNEALREVDVRGPATTLPLLRRLVGDRAFATATHAVRTDWVESELMDAGEPQPRATGDALVRTVVEVDGRPVTLAVPTSLLGEREALAAIGAAIAAHDAE